MNKSIKDEAIAFMIKDFLFRVKHYEKITHNEDEYYWKWIGTSRIADHLGIRNQNLRPLLKSLLKEGKLTMRKLSNVCLWAPTEIKGFKQHKFADYFQKVNGA